MQVQVPVIQEIDAYTGQLAAQAPAAAYAAAVIACLAAEGDCTT